MSLRWNRPRQQITTESCFKPSLPTKLPGKTFTISLKKCYHLQGLNYLKVGYSRISIKPSETRL